MERRGVKWVLRGLILSDIRWVSKYVAQYQVGVQLYVSRPLGTNGQ